MSNKQYRVTLSNGEVLLVEEDAKTNRVSLALEESPGVPYAYIADITPGGVLVMPNSGEATDALTSRLRAEQPDQGIDPQQVAKKTQEEAKAMQQGAEAKELVKVRQELKKLANSFPGVSMGDTHAMDYITVLANQLEPLLKKVKFLRLCESERLSLKAAQPYIFTVDSTCPRCVELEHMNNPKPIRHTPPSEKGAMGVTLGEEAITLRPSPVAAAEIGKWQAIPYTEVAQLALSTWGDPAWIFDAKKGQIQTAPGYRYQVDDYVMLLAAWKDGRPYEFKRVKEPATLPKEDYLAPECRGEQVVTAVRDMIVAALEAVAAGEVRTTLQRPTHPKDALGQKDVIKCAQCGVTISFSSATVYRSGSSYVCSNHASPPPAPPYVSPNGVYHCTCGRSHSRGPVNGDDVYRCMNCGETRRVRWLTFAEGERLAQIEEAAKKDFPPKPTGVSFEKAQAAVMQRHGEAFERMAGTADKLTGDQVEADERFMSIFDEDAPSHAAAAAIADMLNWWAQAEEGSYPFISDIDDVIKILGRFQGLLAKKPELMKVGGEARPAKAQIPHIEGSYMRIREIAGGPGSQGKSVEIALSKEGHKRFCALREAYRHEPLRVLQDTLAGDETGWTWERHGEVGVLLRPPYGTDYYHGSDGALVAELTTNSYAVLRPLPGPAPVDPKENKEMTGPAPDNLAAELQIPDNDGVTPKALDEKPLYTKEFNKANTARDQMGREISEGWSILKLDPDDSDDGVQDLIAVVDTESLADAFIEALNKASGEDPNRGVRETGAFSVSSRSTAPASEPVTHKSDTDYCDCGHTRRQHMPEGRCTGLNCPCKHTPFTVPPAGPVETRTETGPKPLLTLTPLAEGDLRLALTHAGRERLESVKKRGRTPADTIWELLNAQELPGWYLEFQDGGLSLMSPKGVRYHLGQVDMVLAELDKKGEVEATNISDDQLRKAEAEAEKAKADAKAKAKSPETLTVWFDVPVRVTVRKPPGWDQLVGDQRRDWVERHWYADHFDKPLSERILRECADSPEIVEFRIEPDYHPAPGDGPRHDKVYELPNL